jgi:hypothetical protein
MPVVGFRIDDTYWIKRTGISTSYLSHSSPIRRLRRLAPPGGGTGLRSRRRVTAESGGSPEFEFPRDMVVGFRWGLLLRDHSDEGNMFMLTLIDGERQQSPAMVRVASGEASASRTCTKASLSSILASRPTNCSDRLRWLPRVRHVIDLRLCGAIYRSF